jgi:signal transduction histidine kinase
MKKFFSKWNIPSIAVILILVLGIILLLKNPKDAAQALDPIFPNIKFSGEYKIAQGEWNSLVEGRHISSTNGDVCLRGNFLMYNPESGECIGSVEPDTILSVYLNHINFSLSVDGETGYQSDAENPMFGSVACGKMWEQISLPDTLGEPITITFVNPHKYGNENAIDDFLDNINIYLGGVFERQRTETGKLQRMAGIAIVLAAMAILGAALFTSKIKVKSSRELGIIGSVILFAGGYYIFASPDICMWSYNYRLNTTMLVLCKELYIFFVTILIVKLLLTKMKRTGEMLVWISGLLLVVTYIAVLLDKVRFYDSWILWASVEIFICAGLLVLVALERNNLNKKNAVVYVISSFLLVSYIIDYVAVYFGWWEEPRLSMMFFLVVFLGAVIVVLKLVPENMNAMAKAKELEAEQKLLQAKLHESRISVMISQIQPHFLYNSLGVIQELCYGEPERAEKAIGSLAEFLKGNMSVLMSDKLVFFEDELNHTKKYLEIEYLRFEDQLKVEYEICVDMKNFSLPALTLQPIVENAIRYGVRKRVDGGMVKISAYEKEEYYEVIVEDNGPGFDVDNIGMDEGMHIGIKNVRERLMRMCDAVLLIESEMGKGTRVSIQVKKERE